MEPYVCYCSDTLIQNLAKCSTYLITDIITVQCSNDGFHIYDTSHSMRSDFDVIGIHFNFNANKISFVATFLSLFSLLYHIHIDT